MEGSRSALPLEWKRVWAAECPGSPPSSGSPDLFSLWMFGLPSVCQPAWKATHTHTHTCMPTHTHTHRHTCMPTHTHTHTHPHTQAHMYAHTHTHTQAHMYAHTHTHKHRDTHTQSFYRTELHWAIQITHHCQAWSQVFSHFFFLKKKCTCFTEGKQTIKALFSRHNTKV